MTNPGSSRRAAGALEGEILAALWASDCAATPAQVQHALSRPLAYTTVMTILSRLVAKELVARERQGHAYAYRPLVTETAVATRRFSELLERGANRRAVLFGFVEAISGDDARVLRELLDSAEPRPDNS